MAYEMTKRYIGMVLLLMVSLALMAMLVLALGGRGSGGDKSRSNGTNASVRQRRSSPQSIPPSEPSIVYDDDNDTLYDVEDFISDYKITRLAKPNSKYYSLGYDNDDYDDDDNDVISTRSV